RPLTVAVPFAKLMFADVSGPPRVSVSVVPLACVIVTLVMVGFVPVPNPLAPVTKAVPCGEPLMSNAVIFIVARLPPWVCEIVVDALVAAFVPPVYRMLFALFASVWVRLLPRKSGLGLLR